MKSPHAIVVPYPVQGHVIPHMELSRHLARRGFRITFVNSEFNHKRIAAILNNGPEESLINMVAISDGLTDEGRSDIAMLTESVMHVFPREVKAVIKTINGSDSIDDVTCIISDMGWVLDIGQKIGIQTAVFWTMGAGVLASVLNIPKLIEDGVINPDGTLKNDQLFQLSPALPAMMPNNLVWLCIGDLKSQKISFDAAVKHNQTATTINWYLCNTSYELEPAAIGLIPNVLPIGPLLEGSVPAQSLGHFWPEDVTCLNWLDQQLPRSVVYVAFGSITIFDLVQFQELAFGLELCGYAFLWVVRPDMINGSSGAYPEGFLERVATRGRMVGWAPQQKVLSHPSVACFVSHCGWNSTVESVSNGVPFLCWPYFADQFQNQSQICDAWKVGLRLNKNESGIVSRKEIKEKVTEVLENEGIRAGIAELKETVRKSLCPGGSSSMNFNKFVNGM